MIFYGGNLSSNNSFDADLQCGHFVTTFECILVLVIETILRLLLM